MREGVESSVGVTITNHRESEFLGGGDYFFYILTDLAPKECKLFKEPFRDRQVLGLF